MYLNSSILQSFKANGATSHGIGCTASFPLTGIKSQSRLYDSEVRMTPCGRFALCGHLAQLRGCGKNEGCARCAVVIGGRRRRSVQGLKTTAWRARLSVDCLSCSRLTFAWVECAIGFFLSFDQYLFDCEFLLGVEECTFWLLASPVFHRAKLVSRVCLFSCVVSSCLFSLSLSHSHAKLEGHSLLTHPLRTRQSLAQPDISVLLSALTLTLCRLGVELTMSLPPSKT